MVGCLREGAKAAEIEATHNIAENLEIESVKCKKVNFGSVSCENSRYIHG